MYDIDVVKQWIHSPKPDPIDGSSILCFTNEGDAIEIYYKYQFYYHVFNRTLDKELDIKIPWKGDTIGMCDMNTLHAFCDLYEEQEDAVITDIFAWYGTNTCLYRYFDMNIDSDLNPDELEEEEYIIKLNMNKQRLVDIVNTFSYEDLDELIKYAKETKRVRIYEDAQKLRKNKAKQARARAKKAATKKQSK